MTTVAIGHDPLIGQTLGHYRIIQRIGSGGMGVVYKAEDRSLDRFVALKFLPENLSHDHQAMERFRREAKAASALNHPNICTIYELNEVHDQAYISMELVEGQPLSALLMNGALSTDEVIEYGLQLAEGLAHAHEHGVIHRDLKCANVMITEDGRAKVLDFGLAKRLTETELDEATRSQASLTAPGALVGTLAYMPPEQLRGRPADARGDLWALGVVLYEMATARLPFRGQTGYELSSAILNQAPRPLPSHVPTELRAVIERCLQKEPGRRYRRTGEVRAALEAIQAGTVAPWAAWRYRLARRPRRTLVAALVVLTLIAAALNLGRLRDRLVRGDAALRIQSLAVLPLDNLSGDKEQDYFTDGMTEELITNLAKISALKVISRSTMMHYKGSKKPLPQIAKELNVDAVVEGSVLREGGQVRITAQLIQASTDQYLWAQSYQRDLRGVLALQGEIATAIADRVRAAVTPGEHVLLTSARPVNPEAYEAYLKGRFHWYKFTPPEVDAAHRYFQLALEKDPNYAPAYVGIAYVWAGRTGLGLVSFQEARPKIKEAALKAVELNDTLADAHEALADLAFFYEWNFPAAEQEYKRAIELNPNYADMRIFYAEFLDVMGRPQEARAQIERAVELDPLNPYSQAFLGQHLWFSGQHDSAIAQLRKTLIMQPDNPGALDSLSSALHRKGLYEESLAETKKLYAVLGHPEVVEALNRGYALSGYLGAMRLAAQTLTTHSRKTYVPPLWIAVLYARAGEKDQALQWLEKACEQREGGDLLTVRLPPEWDDLRSDPRFQDLLRRMNLSQ